MSEFALDGKVVVEVQFDFEVVPNCGRETHAKVRSADGSERKISGSEAEDLLKVAPGLALENERCVVVRVVLHVAACG